MKITHITNAEYLRDGGSPCISFQSDDSCLYWFIIPLKSMAHDCYDSPVLVNRTTGIEVDLSWGAGIEWLYKIAMISMNESQEQILSHMKNILTKNNNSAEQDAAGNPLPAE